MTQQRKGPCDEASFVDAAPCSNCAPTKKTCATCCIFQTLQTGRALYEPYIFPNKWRVLFPVYRQSVESSWSDRAPIASRRDTHRKTAVREALERRRPEGGAFLRCVFGEFCRKQKLVNWGVGFELPCWGEPRTDGRHPRLAITDFTGLPPIWGRL